MAEKIKRKIVKNTSKTSISPSTKNTQSKSYSLDSNNILASLRSRKTLYGGAVLIILILGLLFIFKGFFIASLVNGEPISRLSVISELEKQGGRATLDNLVTEMLIVQEVRKANIEISQSDIDQEINNITEMLKKQGTTLDEVLVTQGITMDQLNEKMRLQLSIKKLVGENIELSDKEIDEFIEASRGQFAEDATEEDIRKESIEQLKQQKLQQKTQELISNLQEKAKITSFVDY